MIELKVKDGIAADGDEIPPARLRHRRCGGHWICAPVWRSR